MNKMKGKIKVGVICLLLISISISTAQNENYIPQYESSTGSGYQYGNWSFSEHIDNKTLDESWSENNSLLWYPYSYNLSTAFNLIETYGNGTRDTTSIMFVGDNSANNLIHSEFNFSTPYSGVINQIAVNVSNITISGTANPNDFDIYIDTGGTDQTIDGTLVREAWNPTWSTGWKTIDLDTNYSVTADSTYELQFQTQSSDSEGDDDIMYITFGSNTSYNNISIYDPFEGFWDSYSYIGDLNFTLNATINSVYRFNASLSDNSFTMMNDTGCNRTQWLGYVKLSYGSGEYLNYTYPYIIYAFNNSNDFDCLIFYDQFATFAHWDGSNFYNLSNQSELMALPSDLKDYYNFQYFDNSYLDTEGSYFKLIYNELTGNIKFKKWHPFMEEPEGWAVEETLINSTYNTSRGHGIGVWNADYNDVFVDWDFINLWQLNYSKNASAWCNISGYNETRPHMEFPTMNMSNYTTYSNFLNSVKSGNVSTNELRDTMKMLTNNMSMESRMFSPMVLDTGDQNDTIYYYTSVYDNMKDYYNKTTGSIPSWLYDEYLHLHIQMTPDKEISLNEYEDCFVCIDVDNDHTWNANDRIFYIYGNDANETFRYQYNGNTRVGPNYNASVWKSSKTAVGNVHRYTSYMNYAFNIPLAELIKDDVEALNLSDTFGLIIITTTDYDNNTAVWQNWNERGGYTYFSESGGLNLTVTEFMNSTFIEDAFSPSINDSSIDRWGEGQIILSEKFTPTDEITYYIGIENTANVSLIDGDIRNNDNLINYTIELQMLGPGTVSNAKVNMTFASGIEYVSSSLPDINVTNPSGNSYIFNATDTLTTEVVLFNVTVNFTANCFSNGTNYTQIATTFNDQNANYSDNASIQYGTNNAPQFNWTYPENGTTGVSILLANISAKATDLDGDTMNLSFYTNKTNSYASLWHGIGENNSIGNGTYYCNQTFNLSNEYNTMWRWGKTWYWCSVNVTDGKIWTNQTIKFKTDNSRYNVNNPANTDVDVFDLNTCWAYGSHTPSNYYGIYDITADSNIDVFDLNEIWSNRT